MAPEEEMLSNWREQLAQQQQSSGLNESAVGAEGGGGGGERQGEELCYIVSEVFCKSMAGVPAAKCFYE